MKKFITKLSGYLIIASVYPIVMVMASGIAENPGLYVYHFPVWSITLTALNLIIIGAVVVVSADV